MHVFPSIFLWLLLLLHRPIAVLGLDACPNISTAEYDYVVVGAGAGGGPVASRLAERGFSVLVVDVGHDVHSFNTTIPVYLGRVIEDPQIELNYTIDEYPSEFPYTKDDQWYPRGRAIGGSALHNAVINLVTNMRAEFSGIEAIFSDASWSLDNMWNYFKLIEKNLYIPLSLDHGYDGWMKTQSVPSTVIDNPDFPDPQLPSIISSLSMAGPTILDINSRASVDAVGVSTASNTQDENYERSSVRDRLLQVNHDSPERLSFAIDTLATKILLCEDAGGPTAYGVRIARGQGLPVQIGFVGKGQLETEDIIVRREVIVAAGVFQSPQLLSGIGDRDELAEHGIETVVHLPGVGKSLQDHDELSVTWALKRNHTLYNGCTFGSDPSTDPCLKYYLEHSHQNVYAFGAGVFHMPYKTDESLKDPDMDLYWILGYFPGFVRGVGDLLANTPNALTAIALRARPSSRGTVRLTGSHPQDPVSIFKNHFQDPEGGPRDVAALKDGIKRGRRIVAKSMIGPNVDHELWPGKGYQGDEGTERHVYEHVFGHHACCTNKMGAADDELAVLDGNFSVRGVSNLRVVDMSIWPVVPGFFPTTPMYMVSEKAADVIASTANSTN